MKRFGAVSGCIAVCLALAPIVAADAPVFSPCDDFPAPVDALGSKSTIEAFGWAPAASLAIAAITARTDEGRSMLQFARAGDVPKTVRLAGRVSGLAVTADGNVAYAIVRTTDRKGAINTVELVPVDLQAARTMASFTLPATARGLALASGGAALLVVSRNEIRSFQLPTLASGPMYRALGENVGVAPIPGSTFVVLAQPSRVVLADLAGPQDRDGLVLSQESASPGPLTGMLASTGDMGPLALSRVGSDGGSAWCIRAEATAIPPPAPAAASALPVQEPPTEVPPPPAPPPTTPPASAEETAVPPPAAPGTVAGTVAGPAWGDVAAVVFLGPDNVLREAGRAIPDERGRFTSESLPPGSYRIIAAGKGGRVLICDPSFITIRVDSNGAVEAPVLKVLRAQ